MAPGILERLYASFPVWAQNAGISLAGLGWRRERLGPGFDDAVAGFERRERLGADAMSRYLVSRLRVVLALALEDVPAYREAWSRAGLTRADVDAFGLEDLPKLPATRKEDLRRDPWAFVAARRRADGRRLRAYQSSGSTGTPVTAICAPVDHRRFVAAREARSFRWAGSTIRGPRSMIGGRMVVPPSQQGPPFHRVNLAERQIYLSAFHISPRNARYYVEVLNRYRPALLTGYAQSHFLLAQLMNEQGLRLDYEPVALVLGSEKLTAEMKATIRQAFGARAWEEWGAVENCALATECGQGRLHVSPDFGIVEIVRDDGSACAPGEPGRVLCTGLLNEVQPLVRYEIGDIAAWAGEPCPCGRPGLPVIEEIVGRLEDVVVGPDGRRLVRFHGVFIGLASVREGQIVQKTPDRILVRVVPAGELLPGDRSALQERVTDRLGNLTVDVEVVPAIPRTKNGKYRAVVKEIEPESTAAAGQAASRNGSRAR